MFVTSLTFCMHNNAFEVTDGRAHLFYALSLPFNSLLIGLYIYIYFFFSLKIWKKYGCSSNKAMMPLFVTLIWKSPSLGRVIGPSCIGGGWGGGGGDGPRWGVAHVACLLIWLWTCTFPVRLPERLREHCCWTLCVHIYVFCGTFLPSLRVCNLTCVWPPLCVCVSY